MIRLTLLAAAVLIAAPSAAEVVQSSTGGFEISNTVTVAVPPERAWPIVTAPRLWWDKDHTYSDDPANLTLDERPGGCFCEKLPGKGGVEHMRIVYIQPPRMIRLVGALGPLQAEAADGTMSITLTKAGEATAITMTYVAGGYIRAGGDKLAPLVDRVLGLQLAGLKTAIDSAGDVPVTKAASAKAKAKSSDTKAPPVDIARPADTDPQIKADPLADVGDTISGLGLDAQPGTDAPPPAAPPKPRPADQDSPR